MTPRIIICMVLSLAMGGAIYGQQQTKRSDFTVSGTVRSTGAVSGAYVSVKDSQTGVLTDAEGRFTLPLPGPGTYTLIVSATGYKPLVKKVTVPPPAADRSAGGRRTVSLTLVLQKTVVEMGTVEVTADRQQIPKNGQAATVVTHNELNREPIAGVVFNTVDSEAGTVFQSAIADNGYGLTGINLSFSNAHRSYSVYGADSDLNNYYYDYIRIPDNHYYGTDTPIFPLDSISYVEIYKGIAPLEYGPAIGGLFRAVPDSTFDKGSTFELSPNSNDVSMIWKKKLGENSGLLIAGKKSITELFDPAAIWAVGQLYDAMGIKVQEAPMRVIPSYGDLSGRYFTRSGSDTLSIDALAYYDLTIEDLNMVGNYDATIHSFPYFAALGTRWQASPTRSVLNTATVSASYQHAQTSAKANMDVESYYQAFAQANNIPLSDIQKSATTSGYLHLNEQPNMHVFSTEAQDRLSWVINNALSITGGIDGRYSMLSGSYSGNVDMNLNILGIALKEKYDVPAVRYDENVLMLCSFVTADLSLRTFKLKSEAGYNWFPFSKSAAPSLYTEAALPIGQNWEVSASGGWSVGTYDPMVYLERRLQEKILATPSDSSYANLPKSATFTPKLTYKITKDARVGLDPYFAWYYDLSGLALYAGYRNPYASGTSAGDLSNQIVMMDPSYGYSTGAALTYRLDRAPWLIESSYLLSFTRYHQRGEGEAGWFAPNNDVRHTVKTTLSRSVGKSVTLSTSLNVYIDKPFTPEQVVDASTGTLQKQAFNSARDLVPRFTLGAKVEWAPKLFDRPAKLYLDCKNILAFINPTLSGMKQASKSVPGASTADFKNRQYQFLRTDLLDVLTNMEISLGGTIFLK